MLNYIWHRKGKSAYAERLTKDVFVTRYNISDPETTQYSIVVDGCLCNVSIVDSYGQEEFSALRDSDIKKGDGFLCMFSLTSEHSFVGSYRTRTQILRIKYPIVPPIVFVGTKCDDPCKSVCADHLEKLQDEYEYVEVSAKDNVNIEQPIVSLVRKLRQNHLVKTNSCNSPKAQVLPKTQSCTLA